MTPEHAAALVKLRLEQARSSLNDAVVLAEGGGTPMSIINRAYYAMFYAVLALLQNIGRVAGKHTGAIGLFDTEFVLKGDFSKELSRDLHKAFDVRQMSDYQPVRPVRSEEAKEYIDKARWFVGEVEAYLRAHPPA
jgi:uncharacterized protein (UPF0332 family)